MNQVLAHRCNENFKKNEKRRIHCGNHAILWRERNLKQLKLRTYLRQIPEENNIFEFFKFQSCSANDILISKKYALLKHINIKK